MTDTYTNIRTASEWRDYFKKRIPSLNPNWTNISDDDIGIVLVNLLSMLGDELNYRMDMSFLEVFLGTARERSNVQALLSLIGYTLSTYQTSQVQVEVRYPDSTVYDTALVIPEFSRFTSANNGPSYYNIKEQVLPSFTNTINFDVYEGQYHTETHYSTDVDLRGRLYLNAVPNAAIAENAVTILYDGYTELNRVDNVMVAVDKFQFQLLVDYNGRNYIQFDSSWHAYLDSSNARPLIVKYLITNLDQSLAGPGALTRVILADGIVLDRTVVVNNAAAATAHKTPETIETARLRAPRFARTMGTAVTLRDYEDLLIINFDEIYDVRTIDLNYDATLAPYELKIVVLPKVYSDTLDENNAIIIDDALKARIREVLDEVRLATIEYNIYGPTVVPFNISLTLGTVAPLEGHAALISQVENLVETFMGTLKIGESFSVSKLLAYLHENASSTIKYILPSSTLPLKNVSRLELLRAGAINIMANSI